jgi:putative transferase (TIGR04331 family)
MYKKTYYLINSANESTWKFDRPVIFLNESCLLYERKHVWKNMDSIVAKPYGLDKIKKEKDFKNVLFYENKLFSQFYAILNQHHGIDYNLRFWQICLGHWFRHSLCLLVNRVNTIEKCLDTYEVTGTTVCNYDNYDLSTNNFDFFCKALSDPEWNSFLIAKILILLKKNNLAIEIIDEKFKPDRFSGNYLKLKNDSFSLKTKLVKYGIRIYNLLSNRLVRNNDALIITSYLPLIEELKLELNLKQFPQIWQRVKREGKIKPDKFLRNKLTQKFLTKTDNNFENILHLLLFELLPVDYLEGFKNLTKVVNDLPWPKSPKFIFTSNNYNTDEVFKLYTAYKTQKGSNYFVGQHGNNYHILKNRFPQIEELTSDKFITWGWSNGISKYKSGFIFKSYLKKDEYKKKGGLLFVKNAINFNFSTHDCLNEFNSNLIDQKKFISKLSAEPKKNLTIRLHTNSKSEIFSEKSQWREFDPSLKIENSSLKIKDLIRDSRLIIFGYDSTGILETFSANIPTIAFWQNELDHLRETVKPHYQILVDAGIIHLSAQSAAEKVNEIWNDVDGWWKQSHVQDAKNKFCEIYAKNCKNPAKTIASILLEK